MHKGSDLTVAPDFSKMNGLLPVVIQDVRNNEVLMHAFMNVDAWRSTLETGKIHYWSRKKKRLWMKGEQSGHYQYLRELYLDNDQDCALIKVEQVGGAVEDGYRSCFNFALSGDVWIEVGERVFEPNEVYAAFTDELVLGLPSGSLGEVCRTLMESAGYHISDEHVSVGMNRVFDIDPEDKLRGLIAPAQELPSLLESGKVDIALTGWDMVEDSETNPTDLLDLGFNKHGHGAVQWVLAVPNNDRDSYSHPEDYEGSTIITQIPSLVTKIFAELGVSVQAMTILEEPTRSATLGSPLVVEISETGASLLDKDYHPTCTICTSTVHLFAHNESMGYGWKRRRMAWLAEHLKKGATRLPENPKHIVPVERLA